MKKVPWIRIVITIVIWIALAIYQKYFMLFDTNSRAIAQVESSNEAYAEWQMWKQFVNYYWVLYLLPLLLFIPMLFKKDSNESNGGN